MEVNSNTSTVGTKNHTHTQHQLQSEEHKHHHYEHPHFPSKTVLVITITLTSLILLLAISLIIIFILRRLKSSTNNPSTRFIASTTPSTNFNSSPEVKGGCIYGENLSRGTGKCRGVQVFRYKELEVATEGFSEGNVIGNGGFGFDLMYRGVLSDGTLGAIKLLGREGEQDERAFRIQVDVLSRLKSPYLVELIGYCADQEHRLLVFEYVGNGTLQRHLEKEGESLDWWKRMRIALDCARALEFLHEHAAAPTPLIHPHFNSSNLLLDQNLRAKLSHFGIAFSHNINPHTHISTTTTAYFAPEYESTGELTTKSDVYSYGVVLLELLTGRVPVDINRPPGHHALPRLTNREKVEEMVDPALRGKYSHKDLVQVAAIAAMCIQPEADYRPLMTDVVQSLIPLVRNPYSITSSNSLRFHKHTSTPSR
ncbi:putative serine/threonine-protein kinase PBL7 [Senna tora]|uniref:Putative serine/threonine-protein kinase PBL7 n=1 Tax=Senna tora TaxID=362788 RepID=A0A834T8Y6_9FABA|nr:putative serine/threonine-protein kinase PBL7 [Senna tora]